MRTLITLVPVVVALSGCEHFAPADSVAAIETGMTKAEVSKAAGSPTHRHLDDTREAWEYCVNGWLIDDYALVWFDGDRVVGKELEADHEFGRCSTRDGRFSWENAPAG